MNECADEPGVPPDFMSYRAVGDELVDGRQHATASDIRERIAEMQDLQLRDGATFWRATLFDRQIYVEGWREQPRVQGAFNPPAEPCRHVDIWFTWSVNSFTDRPGRIVSVDGRCKCCGAPMYVHGVPFGVSLNQPTTNINCTELRFPITVGDEKFEPGAEAMAGAVYTPESTQ